MRITIVVSDMTKTVVVDLFVRICSCASAACRVAATGSMFYTCLSVCACKLAIDL